MYLIAGVVCLNWQLVYLNLEVVQLFPEVVHLFPMAVHLIHAPQYSISLSFPLRTH